jgi:hypothetical protein
MAKSHGKSHGLRRSRIIGNLDHEFELRASKSQESHNKFRLQPHNYL